MRLKSVILLLVAVLVAGGTAMLVRGWLDSERARLTAALPQTGTAEPVVLPQILVAKTDLSVGQFVRAEDLAWQPWPESALSPTYMVAGQRPLEDFVGAVVRSRTPAGEPIIEGRLISPKNSGFLAAVLPPGMRAVSLPVNATTGVSGFVYPGDRVDLLLTMAVKVESANGGEKDDHRATETVLSDLRVLAIDQRLDNKPGEVMVGSRVTVEVTPKQGEIVALIQHMGTLSLSLRSLGTTEEEAAMVAASNDPAEATPTRGGLTLDSEASRVITPWGGKANQRKVTVVRGDKVDERAVEGGRQ
jgi:pilus assembly protein CpaB